MALPDAIVGFLARICHHAGVVRRQPFIPFVALAVAMALVAASCGAGADLAQPTPVPAQATSEVIDAPEGAGENAEEIDASAVPATFTVQPSVNQLHIIGAVPGTELELHGPDGSITAGVADAQGSFLWRDIDAGSYVVQTSGSEPVERSEPATVTTPDDKPDPSFYADQVIGEGFGYLTTRDGTTLSINVVLPGGEGPFPTVVEYSGYAPSNPDGDGRSFGDLYTAMGYAYVGVNMRGSGCSGGSFEFFEPVQLTDGYDAIEAIAAQPWVLHNEVGMVGISYPGISQLFVASTAPPSLAAITPLSVLDDSIKSTLAPGGILNTGFGRSWSDERQAETQPYGQGWEQAVVDSGDRRCADNQLLRLQNTDARQFIDDNADAYVPELGDPIAPHLLVHSIEVPVFLAGAWQDEQTGGHFPAMLDDFTNAPQVFATMVNGGHVESLAGLAILERYVEFLELYVAKRTPDLTVAGSLAPLVAGSVTGTSGLSLPTGNRFTGMNYEEALASYEADEPVRILFEEGAAEGAEPGSPLPRYEAGFDTWPPPGEAVSWYLGPDGTMSAEPPADGAVAPSSYVADPNNLPPTSRPEGGSGIWQADAAYEWLPIPAGSGVAWVSAPLDETIVAIGSGSVDLWLRSTADDTDLEVTISEVRPDGHEMYIQSGWLRASHRALVETASTETEIVRTYTSADAAPLSAVDFSLARVELFPFAHAFREGSRLRITVDAPGGARPQWAFAETHPGGETNEIAHDADHPSRLVLNLVDGVDVPADRPACGSLRSQPCRAYDPLLPA